MGQSWLMWLTGYIWTSVLSLSSDLSDPQKPTQLRPLAKTRRSRLLINSQVASLGMTYPLTAISRSLTIHSRM
jgi:hypothetical protein